MDQDKIADALTGLTRRDLEKLRAHIDRQLVACMICGNEGAVAYRVMARGHKGTSAASLMLCKPCFEKHRLPELRARTTE